MSDHPCPICGHHDVHEWTDRDLAIDQQWDYSWCRYCGTMTMNKGCEVPQILKERSRRMAKLTPLECEGDVKFIEDCLGKIQYGVPGLTVEEQKRLWEIATGERLPRRKRCYNCDMTGHGYVDSAPGV